MATPIEARALGAHTDILGWRPVRLNDHLDLVIAGIGKANAAGAAAHAVTPDTAFIISVGVAGALPAGGVQIGDSIVATRCVYADEGLLAPDGYQTCAQMGFPIGPDGDDATPDPHLIERLAVVSDHQGTIATVSTCSGTDHLAGQVVQRTGALAEAMEGAAVVHTASRLGLPAAEWRVVSNTTGDRPNQTWDLRAALDRLGSLIGALESRHS